MPMIDIFAAMGKFADTHRPAMDAAATVKAVEAVPDVPMFRKNTALSSTSCPPARSQMSTATATMYASKC